VTSTPLFVTDTTPSRRFPLYCRGNVGEVFPNVMTPMTASLFRDAAARGQERAVLQLGMASPSHVAGADSVFTGVFGGYLYGNVSLARVAAARIPGMKPSDIDRELYGLSHAPPYHRQRGDRSALGTLRGLRQMMAALFRSAAAAAPTRAVRAQIGAWRKTLPPPDVMDDAALVDVVGGTPSWVELMMYHLLLVSGFSGVTRSTVERLVARLDEPGLVNVLTAGLGTIESARPAQDLWRLGRVVAPHLVGAAPRRRGQLPRILTRPRPCRHLGLPPGWLAVTAP